MRTIAISQKGDLKTAFSDKDLNTNAYDLLKGRLGARFGDVEFARPVFRPEEIHWTIEAEGDFVSFDEMPDEMSSADVRNALSTALAMVEERMQGYRNDTSSFVKALLEIPGTGSIYVNQGNAGPKVVITEWGFVRDEVNPDTNILMRDFAAAQSSVLVEAVDSAGRPVPGLQVELKAPHQVFNSDVTDDQGRARLGALSQGTVFTVSSPDGRFQEEEHTCSEQGVYRIVVPREVLLEFRVEHADGRPASGRDCTFRTPIGVSSSHTTDDSGRFSVRVPYEEGDFSVDYDPDYPRFEEEIPRDDSEFVIKLDDEQVEEVIGVEPPPLVEEEVHKIRFINWRNRPLKGQSISVVRQGVVDEHTTDDDGVIELTTPLPVGASVELDRNGRIWTDRIDAQMTEGVIEFRKPFFFQWWWIPMVLLAILLILCLLGGCTKCDGVVIADRPGIQTPAIPEPLPPNGEVISCNDAEGYDDFGNNTIRFDLGEANKSFLFEYYNDVELDLIDVYCDQTGEQLFHVDWSTNTTTFRDSERVMAPCRYIRVEVTGNTNWGVRVNCPD